MALFHYLAAIAEQQKEPITLTDLIYLAGIRDPLKQRSARAVMTRELRKGGELEHLAGKYILPEEGARGKASEWAEGLPAIRPTYTPVTESDALDTLRKSDFSDLPMNVRAANERILSTNIAGPRAAVVASSVNEIYTEMRFMKLQRDHASERAEEAKANQKRLERLEQLVVLLVSRLAPDGGTSLPAPAE